MIHIPLCLHNSMQVDDAAMCKYHKVDDKDMCHINTATPPMKFFRGRISGLDALQNKAVLGAQALASMSERESGEEGWKICHQATDGHHRVHTGHMLSPRIGSAVCVIVHSRPTMLPRV